jgi:Ca2+-binding EF-hand superfamily protein
MHRKQPEAPKAPEPKNLFKKLDSNGDGSISLEEFKASPRCQKKQEKAEKIFKKIDADSSGGISLE